MFPRVALLFCGVFNLCGFILFTFFPKTAVEGYGVGTPNFETDAGQVILFLCQGCGALCLGFAMQLLGPLLYGGSQDAIQNALFNYGVTAAMGTFLALGTPWPNQEDKQAELVFCLQNLFLALMPLWSFHKVPKAGYSGIYNWEQLLNINWWIGSSYRSGGNSDSDMPLLEPIKMMRAAEGLCDEV